MFQGLPVEVGVAGGAVGIAEAFNRNIGYWLIVGAALGFLGTLLLAIPFIGSMALARVADNPLALGTIDRARPDDAGGHRAQLQRDCGAGDRERRRHRLGGLSALSRARGISRGWVTSARR